MPLVESGANALIAFKCYIENNRWAGFLDWRVCGAAVCPKNGMHPFVTDEPPQQSRVFSRCHGIGMLLHCPRWHLRQGEPHVFLAKSVCALARCPISALQDLRSRSARFQHGLVPGRLPKTHERRVPTLCSASDAVSKTCVGPTFSNGGFVASQSPDKNHETHTLRH